MAFQSATRAVISERIEARAIQRPTSPSSRPRIDREAARVTTGRR
jgi:hypothetical protein